MKNLGYILSYKIASRTPLGPLKIYKQDPTTIKLGHSLSLRWGNEVTLNKMSKSCHGTTVFVLKYEISGFVLCYYGSAMKLLQVERGYLSIGSKHIAALSKS